ncbi:MAG: primosomal protein N' [Leptolyngbyaceae bacterium]|nr:primosomal protein N' [Leptolyngbyaceae bacterium]
MSSSGLEPSALKLAESASPYQIGDNRPQWIEVLVDCPGVQGLFTYRLPPELDVQPGDILSVPFGSQQMGAIAIRLLNTLPPDLNPALIRDIEEVISSGFFLPQYWTLLLRVADYYYTPLMQVIRVALPPGLLGRSQRRIKLIQSPDPIQQEIELASLNSSARQILHYLQASKTGDYTWQYLKQQVSVPAAAANRGLRELLQRGWIESYLEPPTAARPKLRQAVTLTAASSLDADLTPRQQEVLEVLKRQGGDGWLSELLQTCRTSSPTLKALEKKGYLLIEPREVLRAELGQALRADSPKLLTPAQAQVLAVLHSLSGFHQVLLHGVTGSGKTEVYLQAIAPILQQGKSALVLVPEIGLTPQLTDRFRARFGSKVCVYHSALSDGERYDTWRQMLTPKPQVVIGTRSAIFAPLPNLGLIVLDEEHDSSFKQDQPAPCYHARAIAQWRAELEECPLVLGSATPSLEAWVKVGGKGNESGGEFLIQNPKSKIQNPKSLFLSLPERVESRPMPPIEVVDMRQEIQQGNYSIFSRTLEAALLQMAERGQQGILFIHRRGHSTFVSCRSCGYVINCPNCDVSLAYHHTHEQASQVLRCHYCNYTRLHPPKCPECDSPYFKFFGSGTQRVTQELARQFPNLRSIRFDSDTTRTKGAHRTLLTQFAEGQADLLVVNQMLTKGIDLPQVTLVGVMAADGLLHLSDYRASERAFQTLAQVAGRAGRGDDPGRVIIQTYSPNHAVIEAAQHHDYQSFVEAELQDRQSLNYPPYGQLVLLRLSSPDPVAVEKSARAIATYLQPSHPDSTDYELLGPTPASVFRVARRYRWQILLKFLPEKQVKLPEISELRAHCATEVSLTLDIDPLNLS